MTFAESGIIVIAASFGASRVCHDFKHTRNENNDGSLRHRSACAGLGARAQLLDRGKLPTLA